MLIEADLENEKVKKVPNKFQVHVFDSKNK